MVKLMKSKAKEKILKIGKRNMHKRNKDMSYTRYHARNYISLKVLDLHILRMGGKKKKKQVTDKKLLAQNCVFSKNIFQ